MLHAPQSELSFFSKLGFGPTTNRRIFWATASVAVASLAVLTVSTAKELAVSLKKARGLPEAPLSKAPPQGAPKPAPGSRS